MTNLLRKLVFQPLSGRVYVNLLEGNNFIKLRNLETCALPRIFWDTSRRNYPGHKRPGALFQVSELKKIKSRDWLSLGFYSNYPKLAWFQSDIS
jgi:hypothetical protein